MFNKQSASFCAKTASNFPFPCEDKPFGQAVQSDHNDASSYGQKTALSPQRLLPSPAAIYLWLMNTAREIWYLLQKELILEWRQRYALSGILLYVLSTIFIVYVGFQQKLAAPVWNVLFWIIMLFASVNAVVKSFVQESGYRQFYYYTLVNPLALLLAKTLYNTLLLLFIGLLTLGVFGVVAGNPIEAPLLFAGIVGLGSLGFGIIFTFISGIAARARHSATLMAILSFPLVIPVLMELIKLSLNAMGFTQDTDMEKDVMILLGIDLLLTGLALVLFPFLWRD